jgi:hypothetical protein
MVATSPSAIPHKVAASRSSRTSMMLLAEVGEMDMRGGATRVGPELGVGESVRDSTE